MNRSKPSFARSGTTALCVSLVAHGLGLSGLAWWFIAHNPPPKYPPLDKFAILVAALPKLEQTPPPKPDASKPPPPKPDSAKPPEPKKPKPPEPVKLEQQPPPLRDDSGEANGTGNANRSTDGRQKMQARADLLEQADLMKDAVKFAEDVFLPSSKGESHANNVDQQRSPAAGTYAPDVASETKPNSNPAPKTPPQKTPGPLPSNAVAATEAPSGTKDPVPNVPLAQSPTPKPIQKEIRGHRATASDTESVAFASTDNNNFVSGRLDARRGVKVKWSEPRYGLASEHDYGVVGDAPTTFMVPIDADGNPEDVIVQQSSGSDNIDRDRKNAVWNSVFAAKDKDGHPITQWVVTCR
jgi:hypothetical protein